MGICVTAALGPEKRGSHFENAVIGGDAIAMQAHEAKLADIERGASVASVEKPGAEKVDTVETVEKK